MGTQFLEATTCLSLQIRDICAAGQPDPSIATHAIDTRFSIVQKKQPGYARL
jgi:hypothetical protein